MDCDPTWEVCDIADALQRGPQNQGGKGGQKDGKQGGKGGKDDKQAKRKGPGPILWVWGSLSTWLLVDGYLTYSAYDSFATTLFNAKTTNNAAWTVANIKAAAPVANWLTASYVQMGLQGWAVFSFLAAALGGAGAQFYKFSQLAMLFPLIEAGLYGYAYSSYTNCNAVTQTQFDQSTTTVTQLSSCSDASATTTLTGYFGTSGTWAPSVSTDPYNTWLYTNVGSAIAMQLVSFMAMKPFKKAYAPKKKQKKDKADQGPPPSNQGGKGGQQGGKGGQQGGNGGQQQGPPKKKDKKQKPPRKNQDNQWGDGNSDDWGNSSSDWNSL